MQKPGRRYRVTQCLGHQSGIISVKLDPTANNNIVARYLVIPVYCFPIGNQAGRAIRANLTINPFNYGIISLSCSLNRRVTKPFQNRLNTVYITTRPSTARLDDYFSSNQDWKKEKSWLVRATRADISRFKAGRVISHASPLGTIKMRHARGKERGIISTPAIHR